MIQTATPCTNIYFLRPFVILKDKFLFPIPAGLFSIFGIGTWSFIKHSLLKIIINAIMLPANKKPGAMGTTILYILFSDNMSTISPLRIVYADDIL